jgi:hypothetical protein
MTDPKTPTSPPGGGEADHNRPGETDEQRREREQRELADRDKDKPKNG